LRLTDVRGFARHVANLDPRTEVPPVGILPGWKRAPSYSDLEIDALLRRRWPAARGRAASMTYDTLFG
jgi:hypothetical protein